MVVAPPSAWDTDTVVEQPLVEQPHRSADITPADADDQHLVSSVNGSDVGRADHDHSYPNPVLIEPSRVGAAGVVCAG